MLWKVGYSIILFKIACQLTKSYQKRRKKHVKYTKNLILLNYRYTVYMYNIVACQRGGVSNKPPGLRAATRHGARDPLVR